MEFQSIRKIVLGKGLQLCLLLFIFLFVYDIILKKWVDDNMPSAKNKLDVFFNKFKGTSDFISIDIWTHLMRKSIKSLYTN